MNEKHQQYWNLKKDKSLISQNTPTESDLLVFKEWLLNERKQLRKSCMIATIVFCFIVLFVIGVNNFWGILLILLFGLLEFSTLKNYFNSKNWIPEYVDYGEVIDKYVKYEKNDNDYYVIVRTASSNLRYKVKPKEYETYSLNTEVIIFAISQKQETFISKKK